MYWVLIPAISYFAALLVTKKYPNLAPHISFGALTSTGLVLAFAVHFIFYPQIESLYASFDQKPTYIISPNILFVGSLVFYGIATMLSTLSKRFQVAFDNTFRSKLVFLAMILLMVAALMSGYILIVFTPLYSITEAIK